MITSRKKLSKTVRALMAALAVVACAGTVMAATPDKTNHIHAVDVSARGEQTVITVKGSLRPMYTAFKLSTPQRLVVDLANSRVKGVPSLLERNTSLIGGVAVSEFTTGKVPVSRVMINFKKDASYRVKVSGNDLIVTLQGGPVQADGEKNDEQVISLANAREQIEQVKKEADERVAQAQDDARDAQTRWRSATAEINNLKAQQKLYQSNLDEAKKEADAARVELTKLQKAHSEGKSAADSRAAAAEAETSRQIAALKNRVAAADETARREQAERTRLEKMLSELQRSLNAARAEAATAQTARKDAESAASSTKEELTRAFHAMESAKQDAADARNAQQAAEKAYREAGEQDRRALYDRVQELSKETVAARSRYLNAEKQYGDADRQLDNALRALELSKKNVARAEQALAAAEVRSAERQKTYEQQLAAMEKTVAKATSDAASLKAERDQLTRSLEDARSAARKDKERATADAQKAIADAEKKVARAESAAREAATRSSEVLAKISGMEKELEEANRTITAQKARIGELEKNAVKEQIAATKESQPSVVASTTPVAAPVAAPVTAPVAAAAPAAAPPAPSKKMTQEEKRLARLQELSASRSAVSTPAVAPTAPAAAPVATPAAVPIAEPAGQRAIQDIRFVNRGGTQKVVISGDGALKYAKSEGRNKTFILELADARLLPMLERKLDVRDFGGAIREISSYRDGSSVRVEVALQSGAKNSVAVVDGNLEWTFVSDQVNLNDITPMGDTTRVVHREASDAYDYPTERTAAYSLTLKDLNQAPKRYTGRRIDLDFKNADIHNILRLLADVGHVNIVTSNEVSGSVTIRMRDVPWDQALDVILETKSYGKVREGNLIRVAPLSVLEAEYEKAIERIKMSKELQPLETRLIPVSYATADELSARAKDLLSDRGKLSVDKRTNVIIARDVAEILDQIEALIRNLDTQTPQVLIEGRIVEATSTYAREIGIQWGGDFSASAATGNPTGLAFPSSIGVAGGATDNKAPTAGLTPVAGGSPNPNFAVNLPAPAGTGAGGALGISLGSIANNANLNLRLSAMEEEGTLRILSSPKILTLDNRQASIEQGTLIPYSRVSASGVQTAFKEAKLNLTVTPHVTADGSILLSINMTRDEPDFNNKGAAGDPTILKREAKTELLVNDGHTAVIGGIFTRNHGRSYKKVPFFGDIPILGWLFKTRSDSDRRSEMLIFITPTIVNRAESIGQ